MQTTSGRPTTILLVDDERAIRQLIRLALVHENYHVIEAGDGANALLAASRHPGPIHLMVTDVVMPGLDGYELAKRLRAERPETKVLYISGYPASSTLGPAERPQVLAKPFEMSVLLAKVRKLLARSQ